MARRDEGSMGRNRHRQGESDGVHKDRSKRTVYQLINQHKIVLDTLFVYLAKVTPRNIDEFVAEFEDEGGVGVCPANENVRREMSALNFSHRSS
jgi:hypothetical protein